MPRIVLILAFALLSGFASAQSVGDTAGPDWRERVRLKGYVKNMQSFQMADLKYVSHNNLVHNRLNFRLYPAKSATIGLEIRNRIFTGDQVNFNPQYAKAVDTDAGIADMSWAWLNEPGIVALTQVDRLWFRWTSDSWDVCVGRQRINWGINAFWNSNDLFNSFNLVDFDYEERPGSDAVRVQRFFRGGLSSIDLAIVPATNDSTWIGAGLYRFNRWTYDFQVLGGWWKDDVAVGAGWAGNLGTAGFKGEVTYFHPQQNWIDTAGALSGSISVDYVLKGNLYVMGGMLFNSLGLDTALDLRALANSAITSTVPPSAKNLMPSKYSAMLSVSRPITPLISGSLVGIYAPGVNLLFLMPSLSASIAANWEFAVFGQSTFLDNGRVFRNYGTSVFARLKWGF